MDDYQTAVRTLANNNKSMPGHTAYIPSFEPSQIITLTQFGLGPQRPVAPAGIYAGNSRSLCHVSAAHAALRLHHLISAPAHEPGTIQALCPGGNRQIHKISIIIRTAFGVKPGHPFGINPYVCSRRLRPSASPYVQRLSYRLQCTKEEILNRVGLSRLIDGCITFINLIFQNSG